MNEILYGFFHDEVAQTAKALRVDVPAETQIYLADLCSRFAKAEHLFTTLEGKNELEPMVFIMERALAEDDPAERVRILRRLGDTALYTSGFFADTLERRGMDIEYYVRMGGMAYQNVSTISVAGRSLRSLYAALSRYFDTLVRVLWELADRTQMASSADMLEVYRRWEETGSDRLRRRLMKHGFVLPTDGHPHEC